VALSKRQKELLERRLEVERRDTEHTMSQLAADVYTVQISRHDSPTDDEHDPEGPTLAFEQSQSAALLRQARERLAQIDAALGRIHDDSYGTCTNCGAAISYARLGARPYTPHCISCAERLGA
jgi:RNA polymerase-binding transcription factor DksA